MTRSADKPTPAGPLGIGRPSRARFSAALALLACLLVAGLAASPVASAGPASTRVIRGPGAIVPIPASIPHEAGDMVDRRIIPDLRWIAARYPIYITDGYSGPNPRGGPKVGCMCHTRGSDHYNGLAVDLVPVDGGTTCDAKWAPITRLARWAEPTQGHPVAPFDWVGYDGDAGHGCGHHLHLGWSHAPASEFRLASWVNVFTRAGSMTSTTVQPPKPPAPPTPPKPRGPSGGVQAGGPLPPPPAATAPSGGVGGRSM